MESLVLSIRLERRWPLWAALAVAIGWFVAAALDIAGRTPSQPDGRELAAIVLALLPPLGLGLVVTAMLPGSGRNLELTETETRLDTARALVTELQEQLGRVDTLLAASAARTADLAASAGAMLPGLGGSAAALEESVARVVSSGEATRAIADGFMAALPSLSRTIGEVDATLRSVGTDSAVQLRAVETMMASVQARNREAGSDADAAIANMTGLLTRIDEASVRSTAALSKRAYALDAAVDGVLERTTAAVDGIHERVTAQLEALHAALEGAGRQLTIFGDDGARLFNQRLDLLLQTSDQITNRFDGHLAGSARLQTTIDDVLQGLEGRFAGVDERIAESEATLHASAEARLAAFEARFAGVGDAGTAAIDAIDERIMANDVAARAAIAARLAELEAQLATLRVSGTAAAGEVAARVAEVDATLRETAADRLAELEARVSDVRAAGAAAAGDVAARVAEIEVGVRAAAAERLTALEHGLSELGVTGAATLGLIETRVVGIEAAVAGLVAPLAASQASIRALGDDADEVGAKVAAADDRVAERLVASRAAMAALEGEAERLFVSVTALGSSVSEGSELVGAAATRLAAEREAVVTLARDLEGHFDTARAALAEIQEGSAAAAHAATAGLGTELGRIAEAADTAAAAMRATLARVVDHAVVALDKAAVAGAETAFGAPVRAQLAAIETATNRAAAAGHETASRLASQMLSLVETVSVVESRVGEVETVMHVRARDSMAARSMRIIEQLNAGSVEVAQMLALAVPDDDWAAYLKGDRSVFARAVTPQLDRETSRRMTRLFQHDATFRAEATHYVGLFEGLIERLLGDRDGEALAATMLSSDVGKIYVALAEASERLPPSRTLNGSAGAAMPR